MPKGSWICPACERANLYSQTSCGTCGCPREATKEEIGNRPRAIEQDSHPIAAGRVTLHFSGRAGEYFRIWIVNICLSIVTLGIYSAWAKVRRKRYFYGNTLLNESPFEYLASAKAILLGRVVVVAAFLLYAVAQNVFPPLAALFLLALLVVMPWVLARALRFNARNSAHRNVRFGFHGTVGGIWLSIGLPMALAIITLGLAFPYFMYRWDRYLIEHSSYGASRFSFQASVGDYYLASVKVLLAGFGFIIGSIFSGGILALPLYLLVRAYAIAAMARLKLGKTLLSEIRLSCDWTTGGLFWLYLVNALAVVFSVGLLTPWAAIRSARYKLERIALQPADAISGFVASSEAQVAALGEEAGELLGFDFGL